MTTGKDPIQTCREVIREDFLEEKKNSSEALKAAECSRLMG